MAETIRAERDSAYWRALQEWVCSVCMDRSDDGECGLPRARVCALKRHLSFIVDTAHHVQSPRMDEYLEAVQQNVCARCPEQDAIGQCRLRESAECALYAYLSLALDAVADVDGRGAAIAR